MADTLIIIAMFWLFGGFCFWCGWDCRDDQEWNRQHQKDDTNE